MKFSQTTHSFIHLITSDKQLIFVQKTVICFQSHAWFVMKTPYIFIAAHVNKYMQRKKILADGAFQIWVISGVIKFEAAMHPFFLPDISVTECWQTWSTEKS